MSVCWIKGLKPCKLTKSGACRYCSRPRPISPGPPKLTQDQLKLLFLLTVLVFTSFGAAIYSNIIWDCLQLCFWTALLPLTVLKKHTLMAAKKAKNRVKKESDAKLLKVNCAKVFSSAQHSLSVCIRRIHHGNASAVRVGQKIFWQVWYVRMQEACTICIHTQHTCHPIAHGRAQSLKTLNIQQHNLYFFCQEDKVLVLTSGIKRFLLFVIRDSNLTDPWNFEQWLH